MERKEPRIKKLKRKNLNIQVIRVEKSTAGFPTTRPKKPNFKNAFLPYEKTIIDKIGDKTKEVLKKSANTFGKIMKEAIKKSAIGTKSIFVQVLSF